jgi:peptidoglycan/LPS O-acetylase OafA/YrhL
MPRSRRRGKLTRMSTNREMWASLAIGVMWLAVALCAVFGPDFVSTTPGGSTTTIPSGIAVGLFAVIVAKRGFERRG